MKLQTQIPLEKQSEHLIDYNSNVLLFGSCFTENIGGKLNYFKFQNLQNPFGILFHPKAIQNLISYAIEGKKYSEKDIFFHNEQWHCFDAHSRLSSSLKDDLFNELNNQIALTNKGIQKATHIIITLGTSWVYRFIESGTIVANCHKVPQKQFSKELLSVEEVAESLQGIIDSIKGVNPEATIIFTVSPVRHLKDGFVENTQSKSHLITAIHRVLNQESSNGNRNSHYFPSYEIVMDELRDYRFYSEDMIHPNQTAVNYIWERFLQVWMSSKTLKIMEEVDTIQKGLQHKPFNVNSSVHQAFLQNLQAKKLEIQRQFPQIVF
ncbi:GSCFA domain-containing protein [Flavobacteriaceae bacterium SZ-1-7]|uniref:GSCFA domain-containing protein n=1 Tax=Tamlana sedimenti TaxID=3134126 RepID=UPI003124DEF2